MDQELYESDDKPNSDGSSQERALDHGQKQNDKAPKGRDQDNVSVVGGYNAKDLLKAPVEAPEPIEIEPEEMTSNQKVKTVVYIGVGVAILGMLAIILLNALVGAMILVLGAVIIAFGVFAPVQ